MEMEKVEVDLSLAYRLLYPRHVVLVSCVDKAGKANIITSLTDAERSELIRFAGF